MKKILSKPPILAAMVSAAGCVPMDPVAENSDPELCRTESSIGTHVREVDCDHNPDESRGDIARSERDIGGIFGDIVLDDNVDQPNFPEGSCGAGPLPD